MQDVKFPQSLSPCASLVRAHDYDRWLCALFAPAAVREDWYALFAFNHEIASVPEVTSEEMLAFIRYAWWREALDEIYAGHPPRKHPVVEALQATIARHALPRAPFDALIDAREAQTGQDILAMPERWEVYFTATSSGLLTLCGRAAGLGRNAATEALGVAWAAIGTARRSLVDGKEINSDLLRLATEKLEEAKAGLPLLFSAFRTTAKFRLKRLRRKKPSALESRAGVVFCLLLARITE